MQPLLCTHEGVNYIITFSIQQLRIRTHKGGNFIITSFIQQLCELVRGKNSIITFFPFFVVLFLILVHEVVKRKYNNCKNHSLHEPNKSESCDDGRGPNCSD